MTSRAHLGRLPCRATLLAVAAAGCLSSPLAWANSEDNLQFSARHETSYDSNLFRIAPGRRPNSDKSDTINATTLGVKYDKEYSLQRIELEASLVHRRYRNFSYLDFSALDYRTVWNWSATQHLRGTLFATRQTRANSYADVSNIGLRNLREEDILGFTGELDLGRALRLVGGLGQRRLSNEQVVLQDRDSRVRTVSGGLRYVYPSGSYVGYGYKLSRGAYLNHIPNSSETGPVDFDQTEHELAANWALTGKTSVRGSVSYLSRKHIDAPQRDFSTPLAEILVRWSPTGKVVIDAGLERAFIASQTDYASYAVGSRFSLRPTWNATAHLSVRMQLEYFDQEYKGALDPAALFTGREDATRLARIALDWRPQEALLFTLQLQAEKRASNFNSFDYTTHGASLSARLRF